MVKKNNPDAPITEVSKKCGEEWRNIDEKVKKKYEKMQEEAKKKYDVEYKEWLENGGEEALKQAKDDRKRRRSTMSSTKNGWKTEVKKLLNRPKMIRRRQRSHASKGKLLHVN